MQRKPTTAIIVLANI